MKYYCVEYDECGFMYQTYDLDKFRDQVCPNCYSPLLVYRDTELPHWIEEEKRNKRSYER